MSSVVVMLEKLLNSNIEKKIRIKKLEIKNGKLMLSEADSAKNDTIEGTVSFERDKKKSIFNYWWKSLLSGIKDSATL